jgi:hypothetical protein
MLACHVYSYQSMGQRLGAIHLPGLYVCILSINSDISLPRLRDQSSPCDHPNLDPSPRLSRRQPYPEPAPKPGQFLRCPRGCRVSYGVLRIGAPAAEGRRGFSSSHRIDSGALHPSEHPP